MSLKERTRFVGIGIGRRIILKVELGGITLEVWDWIHMAKDSCKL